MSLNRRMQAPGPLAAVAALVAGLVAAAVLAGPAGTGASGANLAPQKPATPSPASEPRFEPADTPANLQLAFSNEVNAKERYAAFARQADYEGYNEVARLFRACGQAEDAHAHLHTQAIAWAKPGDAARAVLQRVTIGTTEENLRAALETERLEVTQIYPAMLAKARADRQSMAVRSITFAMTAEREHAALLAQALEHLDRPAGISAYYVCPRCGKTATSLEFRKCPSCFTGASRFLKVV